MSKVKKVILDVPYISQIHDIEDPFWHRRACGAVALLMVIKFYLGFELMPEEIIKEGQMIGGHKEGVGWKHDSLTKLARNYGLNAYSQEFRAVKVDLENAVFSKSQFEKKLTVDGLVKITNHLNRGRPVIVSVKKNFSENKVSHLIVLTGFLDEGGQIKGFYFNDSIIEGGQGKNLFVGIEKFLKFWRKMAIFITK